MTCSKAEVEAEDDIDYDDLSSNSSTNIEEDEQGNASCTSQPE